MYLQKAPGETFFISKHERRLKQNKVIKQLFVVFRNRIGKLVHNILARAKCSKIKILHENAPKSTYTVPKEA